MGDATEPGCRTCLLEHLYAERPCRTRQQANKKRIFTYVLVVCILIYIVIAISITRIIVITWEPYYAY